MHALLHLVDKLKTVSGYRTIEKQEAMKVWQQKLVWSDVRLQALLAHENSGNSSLNTACAGMRPRTVRDEGHISFYRAFERGVVAQHFVDMLRHDVNASAVRQGIVVYERWGHIEHDAFWGVAGAFLNQKERLDMWGYAFDEAAYCGNLALFVAGKPAVLQYRATNLSQLSQAGWKTKMVHPVVAQWFVEQGLWTKADISAQVNSRTCSLDGNAFMGLPENVVCESNYVVDMFERVLRDYGLSLDQQARFVGQAMLSLGVDYWNGTLAPKLADYTGGIELDVLKSVCGQIVLVQDPDEQSLYRTLQTAAMVSEPTFVAEKVHAQLSQEPSCHRGLAFLMDLSPPKDRVALYHLGAMALRVQRRQISEPDTFGLPGLD